MKRVKYFLVGSVILVLGLGGITMWALESSGVAVIQTRSADGTPRTTRVWYVQPDGELWLEAGRPDSPWLLDLLRDPWVRFSSDGGTELYDAEPREGLEAHVRIRNLLRAKYGVRDIWINLLADTSNSVAVLLRPTDRPAAEGSN